MNGFQKCLFTVVLGAMVSGCVTDKTITPEVNDQIRFQEARLDQKRMEQSSFKRHSVPFVSASSFEEDEPVPAYLRKDVYLHAPTPVSLKYYANNISNQIGMPVRLAQDLYSVDRIISEQSTTTTTSTETSETSSTFNSELLEKQSPLAMRESLKLQGSAQNALDQIASTFNVHWKYDKEQVVFYKLETRHLRLNLVVQEQLQTDFVGSTTSGSSQGGLTSTITSSFEGASFDAYHEAIESMLSPYGEVHVLGNSGAVVVTDTPVKLAAVEKFLEFENKNLTKQIAIDIEVVRLTSLDGSDIGVVWENAIANLGDLSLGVISNAPALSQSNVTEVTGTINSGRLAGSELILQALAKRARVSAVIKDTRKVVNNSPATFRDIRVNEYPSEVNQTVTEGVTTFTTTKGTIRPGFDMTILPRITDDNRIILSLVTTMSRNEGFETITGGGNTQRFANLIQKELKTIEVIRDGHTSMLTGYISKEKADRTEGTGKPDFWVLGGGQAASNNKDLLVIFVTPKIFRG